MSRPRIYVGMPIYHSVMAETFHAVMAMRDHVAADFVLGTCNATLVAVARARLVDMFLSSDCERLLWIDADVSFPPETITKLLAVERDIVAAPYAYRRGSSPPVLGTLPGGFAIDAESVAEVKYVPMGLTLMRRCVLERMVGEHPELVLPPDGIEGVSHPIPYLFASVEPHISEDFSFCHRWRAMGGTIHALLDCETVHHGVEGHPMNALKWLMREHSLRGA